MATPMALTVQKRKRPSEVYGVTSKSGLWASRLRASEFLRERASVVFLGHWAVLCSCLFSEGQGDGTGLLSYAG